MSTAKKLFRGSVAQSLQVFIGIIIGLFMLPFMIGQLGESLYGIWIVIGGFTATLYLFDFGFASAVTRYMARHIAAGDSEAANQSISTALIVYTGLACLVAAATFFIAWISPAWLENQENIDLIRILILIAGLHLAVEFPFKAFAGIASAYLRYDLMAWTRIIVRLMATGATIWALLAGYQLVAIALIQLAAGMVISLALVAIGYHLHKPLQVRLSYVNWGVMRSLVNYSSWTFIIDLSRLGKKKAPIFLVAAYLGTAPLTVFYVALRLVEYSVELLSKATGMTTPVFAAYQAKGNMEELKEKVIVFVRINFLLGSYVVYGFLLLGEALIRHWMGDDFPYTEAYYALVVVVTGQIVAFTFSPISSVLLAISKHRWQAILSVCEVCISVALIWVMLAAFDGGILEVAIGSALPVIVGRALVLPWTTSYEIDLSISRVYLSLVLPAFLITIATISASFALTYVDTKTVPGFIGGGVLISAIFWAITLIALKRKEWMHLLNMLPGKLATPIRARLGISLN